MAIWGAESEKVACLRAPSKLLSLQKQDLNQGLAFSCYTTFGAEFVLAWQSFVF